MRAFLSGLALVYASAFASLWVQVDGLLGSHGIAPAALFLERVREWRGGAAWLEAPTLLWIGCPDAALHALCAAGVVLSILLACGIAPRLALAALWAAYLSLVSAGQIFLAYQWDVLLLETGAIAILVAPPGLLPFRRPWRKPPTLAIWLPRCLLFKLMLLSGAVKLLSGDPTWRGLTALAHHFETQPLPAPTSWLAHQAPAVLLSASTLAALAIELLLPPLVFAGRRARQVACAGFALLQLAIGATGNYGFFNALTLALCVTLLDDRALLALAPRALRARLAPRRPPATREAGRARRGIETGAAAALLLLSLLAAADRLGIPLPAFEARRMLAARLAPFHVASAYGLFAVMTTERDELEILGSDDGERWQPYEFRYEPGPLDRAPPFVPLHMPRLDWQLWFAALARCQDSRWLEGLFTGLLSGEPSVLALIDRDPFPEHPPRYLRVDLYRYRFTGPGEPAWWRRERLGRFCPVVELRAGRLAVVPE